MVLNIPEDPQDSKYFRFTQGPEYAWIIPECAWLCLNMSKHAGICMNIPNACLLISRCSHGKTLNTCFNEDYSLKEHEAVFLKRQNLIFSVVAGNIWFAFRNIKYDLSYLFRGVLRQNERRCVVWTLKLGLGTKPTFDAFCYFLSSCSVLLFLCIIRVLVIFQAALRF